MIKRSVDIDRVGVCELHTRLHFATPISYPSESLEKPLNEWRMEIDDAPIFRYIYRNLQPQRHLEFGTWEGEGVLFCLEECGATVWTLNLLEGEEDPSGAWLYNNWLESESAAAGFRPRFLQKLVDRRRAKGLPRWSNNRPLSASGAVSYYQTDARGFIGRKYLDAGLGHRVCQVYCDSRDWDTSVYPADFFDSCLIDGGHIPAVVSSDTRMACSVVRPRGLIMWHDFCPLDDVRHSHPSTRGVAAAIDSDLAFLSGQLEDLFWIEPSWILLGVRAGT